MGFRPVASILLLALHLSGCASYSQTATPLATLTSSPRPPERVRITRNDGARVEIWQPFVRNDSVIGQNAVPQQATQYLVVPLPDVKSVEVRQPSPLLTLALVGVAVGLTVGILELVLSASCSGAEAWPC